MNMATSVILDFQLLHNNICFLHYYLLLLHGNSNFTGQEPPPKIQSFLWLRKEEDLHVISPKCRERHWSFTNWNIPLLILVQSAVTQVEPWDNPNPLFIGCGRSVWPQTSPVAQIPKQVTPVAATTPRTLGRVMLCCWEAALQPSRSPYG